MLAQHQVLVKECQQMITNNLIVLSLWGYQIGDEGAKILATVLSQSSLITLDLGYNYIETEGIKALANKLPQSSLIKMNCEGNKIGVEGAKALAAALPASSLTALNFDDNYIGDEGAKAIAAVLSKSSLTTLSLWENSIGDEGAKALANGLSKSSLTTLDLLENHIGDEGAKALASVLPTSTLTTLSLSLNNIGVEGAKALATVLSQKSLVTLDFTIEKEDIQRFEEAIFTPSCRIYRTGLYRIDHKLKPRKEKFLAAANEFLLNYYINTNSFYGLGEYEKINLFFRIKDQKIQCRNQFMQHFMSKDGDYTKKMGTLIPIKELSQHIMSFVYPALSSQDIIEAWTMAENKLAEITKQTNVSSNNDRINNNKNH